MRNDPIEARKISARRSDGQNVGKKCGGGKTHTISTVLPDDDFAPAGRPIPKGTSQPKRAAGPEGSPLFTSRGGGRNVHRRLKRFHPRARRDGGHKIDDAPGGVCELCTHYRAGRQVPGALVDVRVRTRTKYETR